MGELTVAVGKRGEGRRRGLSRAKSGGHKPGRRGIKGGVEIAAHDRRRAVNPAVDPLQKLLHLKKAQGIVAARHIEVGHIEIDRSLHDLDASDERNDVAGLIIEIAGLDDRKPGQQRFALDFDSPFTRVCSTR